MPEIDSRDYDKHQTEEVWNLNCTLIRGKQNRRYMTAGHTPRQTPTNQVRNAAKRRMNMSKSDNGKTILAIARTIFILGLVLVMLGILSIFVPWVLGHPLISLAILTHILTCYFIATGILKSILAFRLKGLKGWGWIFFHGIGSIILGVCISYQLPFSGLYAIGMLLGMDMLFGAFSLTRSASEN
jgi:hypothetical protein